MVKTKFITETDQDIFDSLIFVFLQEEKISDSYNETGKKLIDIKYAVSNPSYGPTRYTALIIYSCID